MRRVEPGTVDVKSSGQPSESVISGFAHTVRQRASRNPIKEDAATLSRHTGCGGIDVPPIVGRADEAGDV